MKKILPVVGLVLLLLCACTQQKPFATESIDHQSPTQTTAITPNSGTISTTDATAVTENIEATNIVETTGTAESTVPWEHEAALSRFLEDINHNGEIASGDKAVPPGTLPEVEQIPKASQTRVGETASIVLSQKQSKVAFYYSCAENGTERLAVFITARRIPMMVIFETELGGIQELCRHIKTEEVFQGKILSVTNISPTEGNIQAFIVCSDIKGIPVNEIFSEGTSVTFGECIGIVGTDEESSVVTVIKGGIYETASKELREDLDWVKEKFERYSLGNIVSE